MLDYNATLSAGSSSPACTTTSLIDRTRLRAYNRTNMMRVRLAVLAILGLALSTSMAAGQDNNAWVPMDKNPVRIKGSDHRAIVVYQYRLDFVKVYDELKMDPTNHGTLRIYRGTSTINPSELKPYKEMTFKQRFKIMPLFTDHIERNFLICSDILHPFYTARSADEVNAIRAKGFQNRSMPWVNQKGQIDQICSVISLSGDVIFNFPIKQKLPGPLAEPLGITSDGKKAAVMIGEKVESDEEDGVMTSAGHSREVLVWREGSGLETIKISDPKLNSNDLRFKFDAGGF